MARNEEDWFLRGGERPNPAKESGSDDVVRSDDFVTCQNCGQPWPAEVGELCPMCGASLAGGTSTAEYCGADGDGDENARISFDVTLVREKTVEQTYTVTVRARDEDDAFEEARKLLSDDDIDPDEWDWETDEDTAEYGDPRPADAEEVF